MWKIVPILGNVRTREGLMGALALIFGIISIQFVFGSTDVVTDNATSYTNNSERIVFGTLPDCNITIFEADGTAVLHEISSNDAFDRVNIPDGAYVLFDASTTKRVSAKFKINGNSANAKVVLNDYGLDNPEPIDPPAQAMKYVEVEATNISYQSVEVSMYYTDTELGDINENTLVMYHWNGAGWDPLPSSVDTDNNILKATTSSLSAFAGGGGATGAPAKVLGYLDQFEYIFGNKTGTWADDSSPADGVVWPSKAYAPGTAWHTQIEEKNTIRAYVMVLDAEGRPVPSQTVKAWVIDRAGNQTNKTCTTVANGTCSLVWEAWKHPDDSTAGADQHMYGKFDSRKIYNVTIDYNSDDVGDLNLSFMAYCILDTFFGSTAAERTANHCEDEGSCDPHGRGQHFTKDDQTRSNDPSCVDCHGVLFGVDTTSGSGGVTGETLMSNAPTHPRLRNSTGNVVMCWDSTCHNEYSSDPIANDMPVPGWSAGSYNTTNAWYGDSSWTNGSWCESSECHISGGNATPFNASVVPLKDGHSSNISCKYCHSDNFHNTPTIVSTPGYNDTGYYGTCYKDCHTTQVNHNNNASVNCATCHYNVSTAPMHKTNLTSNTTTCGTCHQNDGFSGAPQIPYPMKHSDTSRAGWKWNKTAQYYWNGGAAGFTNSSCAYCHGYTFMTSSALGRPSLWMGLNTLNSSINATNNWCASCHYQNYASGSENYTNMTSIFEEDSLPVPPEIANHSQYAPDEISGYTNHSESFVDNTYNDSKCFTCHGNQASGATNMTQLIHSVSSGGGPDCVSCHDVGGSASPAEVNVSYMNASSNASHKNLTEGIVNTSTISDEIDKACWACHGNGTQPLIHPDNYKTPWECPDCHANTTGGIDTSTGKGNYSAPGVFAHVNSTVNNSFLIATNITTSVQCQTCHNRSVAPANDTLSETINQTALSNVSHYGTNQSLYNESYNCWYCHKNETNAMDWYIQPNDYVNYTIRHPAMNISNYTACKYCHNSTGADTFHSQNLSMPSYVHSDYDWEGDDTNEKDPPALVESCYACHLGGMSGPADAPKKSCEDCHIINETLGHPNGPYTSYSVGGGENDYNISSDYNQSAPIIYEHYFNAYDVQTKNQSTLVSGGIKRSTCLGWNRDTLTGVCHGITKGNRTDKYFAFTNSSSPKKEGPYRFNAPIDFLPNTTDCIYCHLGNSSIRRDWGDATNITNSAKRNHTENQNSDCYICHVAGGVAPKDFHAQELDPPPCETCHYNWDTFNSTQKSKFINETDYNASVHGNLSVISCTNCHTNTSSGYNHHSGTDFLPPESGWKWCEDCHVVNQTTPVSGRHNLTDNPLTNMFNSTDSVMNVTDCTACHNTAIYNSAKATYNRTSGKDCRFCHAFPDLRPGGD